MNPERLPGYLLVLCCSLAAPPALAANVSEDSLGKAVERQLDVGVGVTQWVQDPDRVAEELGDTIETRERVTDALETIKLANLVEPIRFESGVADIPESTVLALGAILDRMQDRLNVRLHLVGHADNQPLSPRLEEIYGDNAGLSRERAGQVAEHFQTALVLPPEAVSYDWAGDTLPVASNETEQGRAMNRRVEVEIWYDEPREKLALEEFLVPHEIERVKVCRMETVCKLRYIDGHAKRARVQNLVVPLYYGADTIEVDDVFVERIRQSFENLSDKQNVVVKFIGYTDEAPLVGRSERIYGDHVGLSKARARRVALAVQDGLSIPTAMVESDGRGASRSLGSNATENGRALNRRVEVEFWYDDPLQELPDEPQLCPEDAGAEIVTRVYDPPWGEIANIEFVDGLPVVPAAYTATLERALAEVADKTNPRLRFVGYTRNEHLQRRTAAAYGDDIGLSASRARRTMEVVTAAMQIDDGKAEFEGRGFVYSSDVVNAGFIQGDTSHVAVQVVYDELAILDNYEGVDITRLTRELSAQNPLGLNLMRITVDGKPIDDPKRSSSDIQRCTDVAMANVDIRFGFDNLRSAPRLSVAAEPPYITMSQSIEQSPIFGAPTYFTGNNASLVRFRMYTNYSHFIDRAEVRIFEKGRSPEAEPLDVVAVGADYSADWQPSPLTVAAPLKELSYVLRAYGDDGSFDETKPAPLWVVNEDQGPQQPGDTPEESKSAGKLLTAYGENRLNLHNIGLSSGTVTVRGSGIAEDQSVWVAGRPIPVDHSGSFVTEEVLPEGAHTVEVAVLDDEGSGELYLRDLEFEPKDWFYVGMADITLSDGTASGPIELFQGENSNYDYDSNLDGRLAVFVNGKFGDHWKLTASADTGESSLDTLFSNFMDKSPDALFRRIDPDYHYPTFGDDGTVEEMAPSMGKLFVRLGKGDDYGQWGNFKVGYYNNELAQVDRGLNGGNFHWQSDATTEFGDRRLVFDAFAAEPGTIASREEFRGAGGSLFYLKQQDLLMGSERVRIELRDKASGIVTGVVNLMPAMDYDIDYLQGRIVLAEPLDSTSDDDLLVRSGAVSGDEAYLVVRYEYSPGFDEIDTLATGGQVHYWFGDHVKLGVTSNVNKQGDEDSNLNAADLTLRWSAGSWLKVQQATSEGLVSLPLMSSDGGFEFNTYDPASFVDAKADATRTDLSIDLGDFVGFTKARFSVYVQEADAGYSAPGLTAVTDTENRGGAFVVPLGDRFTLGTKVDQRSHAQGVELNAEEYDLGYRITDRWEVQAGYRRDERYDNSIIVPLTQQQGERTDAVLQVGYDSQTTWNAYAFTQDTLSVTGTREENARFGFGGAYRLSDKLRIDAEVSDGDQGVGGRMGTNYLHSERTSLYLNYALENERTDNAMRMLRGRQGNLVAGMKSRLADSTSVYLEERYQYSEGMAGLTHATGIEFAPNSKWNIGFNTDIGTLQEFHTSAETDRVAGGIQIGFNADALKFSSGIEYRNDDIEQIDQSRTERETWLFRSNFKYQISPASRLLGKFNHSDSDSSLGTFYDGGYTEAVFGFAHRPVYNDRLNTLVKYTYFQNVPTTEQVGLQYTTTEFIQKSQIAAFDITYDITPNLTIGGKYAYRLGQISLDREKVEFFDSNASLYVLRGDYRFRKNWEALAEIRMLEMRDFSDRRAGALVALSRYVGDHFKIGLGYNFTDFSDDLTDLDYSHQGVFLNLTGTL